MSLLHKLIILHKILVTLLTEFTNIEKYCGLNQMIIGTK